jgi:hypothetical protein
MISSLQVLCEVSFTLVQYEENLIHSSTCNVEIQYKIQSNAFS